MLDPSTTKPNEHPFLLNHGLGSRSDNYDTWEGINNGSRGRKTSQNHSNYGSRNGIDWRFREENKDGHESGVCSPPLWSKSSPPRSPQHQRNHYRSLSPASRAQAIVRGQNELMEMVRNMPETCYELSMKDLVEHPMVLARQQSMSGETNLSSDNLFRGEDNNNNNNNNNNNKKRNSIDRKTPGKSNRSGLENGGFLLKMVFPVTFRSKTKKTMKKNDSMANSTTSARVSPKPLVSDGSAKGVDKEWWKKRFSVSGESESGDSSINSGASIKSSGSTSSSTSSRSSTRRHGNGGCWSFILIKKNKRRNHQ